METPMVAERTRAFVREMCIPAESRFDRRELDPRLRAAAQEVGQ